MILDPWITLIWFDKSRAWNSLGMCRLTPLIQALFPYFLDSCMLATLRSASGWMLLKLSGYWHKQQFTRLFHAWIDSFMLLKLGAVKVCALGVLLVCNVNNHTTICTCFVLPHASRSFLIIKTYEFCSWIYASGLLHEAYIHMYIIRLLFIYHLYTYMLYSPMIQNKYGVVKPEITIMSV